MNATGTLNIPFTNLEIIFFLVNNARPVQYDNWLTQFSGKKKKKGMGNRFSQVKTAMLEISK